MWTRATGHFVHLKDLLRLFLSIASRIPAAQDFRVTSFAQMSACTYVPQTKLDSKLNVCFFQTSTVTYIFFLHNNSVHIILFNFNHKKFYRAEKNDIGETVHKTVTLGCKL